VFFESENKRVNAEPGYETSVCVFIEKIYGVKYIVELFPKTMSENGFYFTSGNEKRLIKEINSFFAEYKNRNKSRIPDYLFVTSISISK